MADEGAEVDVNHPDYDPMKGPRLKPRNSADPGWKYGHMVIPRNTNIVKCSLCGKVTQGGIKRHKEHLAALGGDAKGCPHATTQIMREMHEYLVKNRRSQPFDDDVVEVDAAGTATSSVQCSNTRREGESSGTAAKRNKRAFDLRVGTAKKGQPISVAAKSVASMLRKKPEEIVDERRSGRSSQGSIEPFTKKEEERHYVNMQWALFFYECGVPFNVASSRQFQIAIEASCQYGSVYKPPHELREPLLRDCVKETKLLRVKHEAAWKQYGCTLISDGWSDRRGRHLINFLVNSPEGYLLLGVG